MTLTRQKIITAIRTTITDALNRQNTAAKVRYIYELLANNLFNPADDSLPITSVTGLQAALDGKANVGTGGGSPGAGTSTLWQPGVPVKQGQFLHNSQGVDFYPLDDIADPEAEPFLTTSTPQANAFYHLLGAEGVEALRRSNAFGVRFRADGTAYYATAAQLAAATQPGDSVRFVTPGNGSPLTLLRAVSYITNGLPLAISDLTDVAPSGVISMLGGAALTEATPRRVAFLQAATRATIEADLYILAGGGTAVHLENGAQLIHRGRLGGYGGDYTVVYLDGSSRYHFTGVGDIGGSRGFQLQGSSYAELQFTEPATFNFRAFAAVAAGCELVIYGGVALAFPYAQSAYINAPFSHICEGAGTFRLKTGTYDSPVNPAIALDAGGVAHISSAVTVNSPTDPTNYVIYGVAGTTVHLYEGCTIDRSRIDPRVTVIEEPSDAGTSAAAPATGGLQIYKFGPFPAAGGPQTFSLRAGTTAAILVQVKQANGYTRVITSDDYTDTGSQLTINAALTSGDRVEGVAYLQAGGIIAPPTAAAPTVSLSGPSSLANNATGTYTATYTVDQTRTPQNVKFYDGNTLLATDTAAPFTVAFSSAVVGSHSLRAVITDSSGATAESQIVPVTVAAVAPGPTPGSVFAFNMGADFDYNTSDGIMWIAAPGDSINNRYDYGTTSYRSPDPDPRLYETVFYGPGAIINLPLAQGTYSMKCYLRELVKTSVGQRTSGLRIAGGATLYNNVDAFVDPTRPIVEIEVAQQIVVGPTGGLTLQLIGSIDQPIVNAIKFTAI